MSTPPETPAYQPRRPGRPAKGMPRKTREENLERMRINSSRYINDARNYRRLMQGLDRPMTVDEILAALNAIVAINAEPSIQVISAESQ